MARKTTTEDRVMDGVKDPGINIPKLDELAIHDDFSGIGGVERDVGRKPIAPTKSVLTASLKGMASGLKSAFKTELFKAVPALGPVVSDVEDTMSELKAVRSEIGAKIRPMVVTLEQSGRKVLPAAEKFIPKKLYEKAIKTLDERERRRQDEAKYTTEHGREQLKKEAEENEIRDALAEIFRAQQETSRSEALEKKKTELTNMVLESERHKRISEHFTHLYEAARSTELFHRTVHTAYLRKSLELKYKHLFIARDTYQLLAGSLKTFESYFKAITKNTFLPEAAKYKVFSTDIDNRNRAEAYGEVFSNYLGNVRKHVLNKVKGKIQDAFSGLGSLVEQIGMGADMYETSRTLGEMTGEKQDAPKGIAKLLGWTLGRVGLGGPIRSIVGTAQDPRNKDLDKALTRFRRGAIVRASNLKKRMGLSENRFIRWISDFLPGIESDIKTENELVSNPEAATPFDKMTRQSIVEIIPGYLAKILQSTESLRQGKEVEQTVYDVYHRKFMGQSEFRGVVREKLIGSEETRRANFEQIMGSLRAGAKRHNPDADVEAMYKDLEKDIHRVFLNHARYGEFLNPDEIRAFVNDGGRSVPSSYITKIITDLDNDPVKVLKAILDGILDKNGVADRAVLSDLQSNVINTMELDLYKTELPKMREIYGYNDMLADKISTRQKNLLLEAARGGNKKAREILKEKLGVFSDDNTINMGRMSDLQSDINYKIAGENVAVKDPDVYTDYVRGDIRKAMGEAIILDKTGLGKIQRKYKQYMLKKKGVKVTGDLFDEETGLPVDAPEEFYTELNKGPLDKLEAILPKIVEVAKLGIPHATEASGMLQQLETIAKRINAPKAFFEKLEKCREESLSVVEERIKDAGNKNRAREEAFRQHEAEKSATIDAMFESLNGKGKSIDTTKFTTVPETSDEELKKIDEETAKGGNNLGSFLDIYTRGKPELIRKLVAIGGDLKATTGSIFEVVDRLEKGMAGEYDWTKDVTRLAPEDGRGKALSIEDEKLHHPIEFAILEEVRGMGKNLSIIAKKFIRKGGDDDGDGDIDGSYEDQMGQKKPNFGGAMLSGISKLFGGKDKKEKEFSSKGSGVPGLGKKDQSGSGKSDKKEDSGSTISNVVGGVVGTAGGLTALKAAEKALAKAAPEAAHSIQTAGKTGELVRKAPVRATKKVFRPLAHGNFKQFGKNVLNVPKKTYQAVRHPFQYVGKKAEVAERLVTRAEKAAKAAEEAKKLATAAEDSTKMTKMQKIASAAKETFKQTKLGQKLVKAKETALKIKDVSSKAGKAVAEGAKRAKDVVAKTKFGQKTADLWGKVAKSKLGQKVAEKTANWTAKFGSKAGSTAAKSGSKFGSFMGKAAKGAGVLDLLFAGVEAQEGRKNAAGILDRDRRQVTDGMRDTVASQKAVNSLGFGIGDYLNKKLYGDKNAHAKALVDIDEMTGLGKLPSLATNFAGRLEDYGWYNPVKWAAWVADGATGVADWTLKAAPRTVMGLGNAIGASIDAARNARQADARAAENEKRIEEHKVGLYPKLQAAIKDSGLEGTPVTGTNGKGIHSKIQKAITMARKEFGSKRWDAVMNEALKKDPKTLWVDVPELYDFFVKHVHENYLTDEQLARKGDEASLVELNARKMSAGSTKEAIDILKTAGINTYDQTKNLDASIVAVNKAFSNSSLVTKLDRKDRKYVQAEAIKSLQDYAKDPQGFAEREAARDTEREAKATKDAAALEGQTAEIQAKLDATAPAATGVKAVEPNAEQLALDKQHLKDIEPLKKLEDKQAKGEKLTDDEQDELRDLKDNGVDLMKKNEIEARVKAAEQKETPVAATPSPVKTDVGQPPAPVTAARINKQIEDVKKQAETQKGKAEEAAAIGMTKAKTAHERQLQQARAAAEREGIEVAAEPAMAAAIVAADNQSVGGKTVPMPSKEPPSAEEEGKINYENTSSVIKAFIKEKGGEEEAKKLTASQFKSELTLWYRNEYDKYKKANRSTPGFKAMSATRLKGMVTKLEVAGTEHYAKMYGISGRFAIDRGELIDPKTGEPVDRTGTAQTPASPTGMDTTEAKAEPAATVGETVPTTPTEPSTPTPVTAPEVAETIKEAGEGAAAKTVPTPTKSGKPKTRVDRTESRMRQKARQRRQEALAQHEAMMKFYADEVKEERTVDADGTVHVRKSTGERRVIGGDFVGKGMFTEHQYGIIKAFYSEKDKADLTKDVPAAADMFKLAEEGKFREPVEGEKSYKAVQAKKAKVEGIPEEITTTKDVDELESRDGDSVGDAADILKKPVATSMADLVNQDVARKSAGGTSRGSSKSVVDLAKNEIGKEDAGISSPSTRNLLERPKPVTANAEESATVVAAKATVQGAEKVEAAVGPTIEALKKQQEEQQKQWQSVVDQNNQLLKLLTGVIDPANGFKVAGMSELTEVCGTTKPVVVPTPGPTQVIPVPAGDKENGLDLRKKQW